MERIHIFVARDPEGPSDVAVEWHADLGNGSVDFSRPLPPGRQKLWPERLKRIGHLFDGHVMIGHLDSTHADGHVEVSHLGDGHLHAGYALVLQSPRYVFGRFRHALRMFDGAGNATDEGAVVTAHTVNASPPIPSRLRRTGWNAASLQLQFAFEPVRFNPVIGN